MAYGRRPAVEPAHPETLADHGRTRTGGRFLRIAERAAGDGRRRVDGEESRRDATALQPLRLVSTRVRDTFAVYPRQGDETAIQALPILEASGGDETRPVARDRTRLVDRHQLIGVGIGQWFEQHGIHERED